eukprot:TRINITY_DN6451_c0_g1_i4.p1 TRINITY_DN6451_c0_g1~~TRINITY_DN6451_c0_g1_i4.p1  ORF type:complete len:348 (-),score=35.03 TRINITY_DN6451_c0_g1_i4:290-1333(-)
MRRSWIQATFAPISDPYIPMSSNIHDEVQVCNNDLQNLTIQQSTSTRMDIDIESVGSVEQSPPMTEWDSHTPSIFDENNGDQMSDDDDDDDINNLNGDIKFVDFGEKVVQINQSVYRISCADRIHQHTLSHTGLMLWEGSEILAKFIDRIGEKWLQNKFVVELGAGVSPLCGLAAAKFCRKIVLTDGNLSTMPILKKNIRQNSHLIISERVRCQQLVWDDTKNIQNCVKISPLNRSFDVVLGTDVMYSQEFVKPFFSTCQQLLSTQIVTNKKYHQRFCNLVVDNDCDGKYVILCFVQRGVGQDQIDECALQFGFQNVNISQDMQQIFQECAEGYQSYVFLKMYKFKN